MQDTAPATTWLLRAEAAGKSYGRTVALAGAQLEIRSGEAVAVMGPSGSGKSTLLHVLAGIVAPDAGRVLLRGEDDSAVDVAALDDDERSALRLRRFGFVFQQGMLLPELTASENVALPLLLLGVAQPEARRRADGALAELGLHGLGARRIGQLSGGQAQRVAIARALIAEPRLVFADEPTGALDSRAADAVLRALLAGGRGPERALVVVTHDEAIAAHCDRIVRLSDGRIDASAGGTDGGGTGAGGGTGTGGTGAGGAAA